jgi:transducin (beta)-like 1
MAMIADEVNLLICRYLQESGFGHTAFMFGCEAMLDETDLNYIDLPPQSLVTVLKKGMLYMQLEKGINERARAEDSADHIIGTIVDCVKRREPLQAARAGRAKPPPPAPSPAPLEPVSVPGEAATVLRSHFSSVYCGCFTPDGRLLATGSADATAIIWELHDVQYATHYILDHATQQERQGKDIAIVAWNPGGSILATGCYDGTARLWTARGELKCVLVRHSEAVFTVKFSPDGLHLLTGSADKQIIAWNAATGAPVQVFSEHQRRVLDVDWFDNEVFASASGDGTVCVFKLGQPKPILVLSGHTMDVNKLIWDRPRRMLATCSDDKTVRVWRPFERGASVVLQGHTREVYTIGWAPEAQKILVSASFDQTLRIWDVHAKTCLHVISKHQNPIYALAFSPRGQYFVSAGIDADVFVWRTADAGLAATYRTTGSVFDVAWDPAGNAVALCMTDATVVVIPTGAMAIVEK